MLENLNQELNIKKAIIKTVAFFDIFDYPLTVWEIWKWLYSKDKVAFSEIFKIIDNLKVLEKKQGFYFLRGRKDIIKTRLWRYNFAEIKYQLALRATQWLRWLAPVKMVAVVNDLGYNNAPSKSDIDVLIITSKNRIWLTRLMVTMVVQILGLRRHRQKITNRICLSFYLSESHLDLKDILLANKDPYLVYWLPTISPLFDDRMYQMFFEANFWLKDFLANIFEVKLNQKRRVKLDSLIKFSRGIDSWWLNSFLGEILEKMAKFIQLIKMAKNTSSVASSADSRVVISDEMLKFHERDRRAEFKKIWEQKLDSLIDNRQLNIDK